MLAAKEEGAGSLASNIKLNMAKARVSPDLFGLEHHNEDVPNPFLCKYHDAGTALERLQGTKPPCVRVETADALYGGEKYFITDAGKERIAALEERWQHERLSNIAADTDMEHPPQAASGR